MESVRLSFTGEPCQLVCPSCGNSAIHPFAGAIKPWNSPTVHVFNLAKGTVEAIAAITPGGPARVGIVMLCLQCKTTSVVRIGDGPEGVVITLEPFEPSENPSEI